MNEATQNSDGIFPRWVQRLNLFSLFSSLKALKGLGAQLLPHLLPNKWPVQVASFHLQQLMMNLAGSTLPCAQGALVLVVPCLDGWNMGCGVSAPAAALSQLAAAPSWKALQKDLRLVNDPSSVVRAHPAPQASAEDAHQSPGGVWVPKSNLPKPWKLLKASSTLCETRAPPFLDLILPS